MCFLVLHRPCGRAAADGEPYRERFVGQHGTVRVTGYGLVIEAGHPILRKTFLRGEQQCYDGKE
jgi:hypothetical protein